MTANSSTTISEVTRKDKTQNLYDRVADVQNLISRINRYRDSVARYFRSLRLDIGPDSRVLDAGCGTGLVSLAFYSAGYRPKETIAFDLSFKSLEIAKEQFANDRLSAVKNIVPLQGNILSFPFEDGKFDVMISCGALEYVPLDEGLREMARVLKPGGYLALIPIRPSVVGSVLEILYNFKLHSLDQVREVSSEYFEIVDNYQFPITEPIGWSKMIFLLRRK